MARIAGMFPFRRDRGEDTELFLLLDAAQKPLHAFRIVLPGRQDDHRRQEQWQRQYRRFARRMLHRFGDRPLTELKIEAYRLGKERLRNTWPEDTDKYRKLLRRDRLRSPALFASREWKRHRAYCCSAKHRWDVKPVIVTFNIVPMSISTRDKMPARCVCSLSTLLRQKYGHWPTIAS